MKLGLSLLMAGFVVAACGSTQPSSGPTASPSLPLTPAPTATPVVLPTSSPTLPPPTEGPSSSPEGATLLIEAVTQGGFISPTAHLGVLPDVVVDTAGNIYTADPNAPVGALIPLAVVRDVGSAGVARILAAVKAAGLDQAGNGGGPGNPDAGVTVFTVEIDGQDVVNQIASGGGPGRPGASESPALDLLTRLEDPTETWGADHVTPSAFTPTAYKVYDAPTSAGTTTIDWPLSTPLAAFGTAATPDLGVTGLRTGAVSGLDATKLASAASGATSDTVFVSDGQQYQVWIRPLLPPELAQ